MDLQLKGKCALITGSSRGLGAAMAKTLAAEGVKVILHGRNEDALKTVAAEIGGPDATGMVMGDMSQKGVADRIAEEAEAIFGGVDILVNNAGLSSSDTWHDIDHDEFMQLYATNVVGPARLCSLIAVKMAARGFGRLIHIGSSAAGQQMAVAVNYTTTKTALASLSATLAKTFADQGVTSNTIGVGTINNWAEFAPPPAPGQPVDPDPAYSLMTQGKMGHLSFNSVKRSGTPEEVAYAVTMLASPLSGFINGALLRVDGGQVSTIGF